jgi:pimeloyl-ACP methyl ester carboxylesterase
MTAAVPIELTSADGVRLSGVFRPRAGAPACLVAHGFTGSSRNPQVRRLCDHLAAAGFAVLALDFRGHGRSGGRVTAGVEEVHDVAAGVAWLRAHDAARVAVLGWSMGGTAVLRHAGSGGDADAVVSVSAPGVWWERGTRPMRLVHWMFETRTGRAATRVLRRTRVSAQGWDEEPEPPPAMAAAIAPRPLLLVHGDADHYFPLRHVEALAAGAPHAQVWVEPGMGHAENATTADLLDRIVGWLQSPGVLGWSADGPVCNDGRRE